jgi:hypothetical protein
MDSRNKNSRGFQSPTLPPSAGSFTVRHRRAEHLKEGSTGHGSDWLRHGFTPAAFFRVFLWRNPKLALTSDRQAVLLISLLHPAIETLQRGIETQVILRGSIAQFAQL